MLIDIAMIFAPSRAEAEAFCDWAFGDNWESLNGVKTVTRWNTRHSDWFKLDKGGNIRDDVERMWSVYEYEQSLNAD